MLTYFVRLFPAWIRLMMTSRRRKLRNVQSLKRQRLQLRLRLRHPQDRPEVAVEASKQMTTSTFLYKITLDFSVQSDFGQCCPKRQKSLFYFPSRSLLSKFGQFEVDYLKFTYLCS
jgi:hypothetical protein